MIQFKGTIEGVKVRPVKKDGVIAGTTLQVTLTVDMNGDVLRALAGAVGQDVRFTATGDPVLFDDKKPEREAS